MTEDRRYMRGLLSGFLESKRLLQASKFIENDHAVLDLACNEGRLIDFIAPQTAYLGIDISANAIDIARQKHPNHEFLVADLQDAIPNMERKFDVIVMLAFLEHIPDPDSMLRTVTTALKQSGKIVITTPAPRGRQIHDLGAKLGLFSKEAAEEHETFLGKSQLENIAHDAGLRIFTFKRFLFGFNQLICLTNE